MFCFTPSWIWQEFCWPQGSDRLLLSGLPHPSWWWSHFGYGHTAGLNASIHCVEYSRLMQSFKHHLISFCCGKSPSPEPRLLFILKPTSKITFLHHLSPVCLLISFIIFTGAHRRSLLPVTSRNNHILFCHRIITTIAFISSPFLFCSRWLNSADFKSRQRAHLQVHVAVNGSDVQH